MTAERFTGKGAIAGCRRALRHVMFQATLVAGHHNPSLKSFADRLRKAGKPHKVIMSGQFRGRSRISKYGNARLRRTLWMAGQTAVLHRASFRDKFERYIAQDRDNPDLRRKAYTAIAAKMARTIHAVIKSGEPYAASSMGATPSGRTSLWRAVEAAF